MRLNAKRAGLRAFRDEAPRPDVPTVPDEACLRAYQGELDYLHRTLMRLGAATSDVEDLLQEVFLALRGCWDRCDKSRPLRPYLFGIAFRVASAHRRKRRREVPFGALELPDAHADLDGGLQGKQERGLILAALERVPLRRRAALILHELDGIPVTEIASTLKISRFTVYVRLRKARRELAAGLRKRLNGADKRALSR